MGQLAKTKISSEMLLSELRVRGIRELGELRRVYLEPAGGFSLLFYDTPQPGLSIAPEDGDDIWHVKPVPGVRVCSRCGSPLGRPHAACTGCGADSARTATLPV